MLGMKNYFLNFTYSSVHCDSMRKMEEGERKEIKERNQESERRNKRECRERDLARGLRNKSSW